MPLVIRKLDEAEAANTFTAKSNKKDLTEYIEALKGLNVGDSAEVPANGETSRVVVRRFNAAAKELGLKLEWKVNQDTRYLKIETPKTEGSRRGRKPAARPAPADTDSAPPSGWESV